MATSVSVWLDRVDGADLVLLVIIVNQLNGHFRVRLAVELIAVLEQLVLQFLVVLDNTVVHAHNKGLHRSGSGTRAVARDMGMRVCLRRVTMSSPARVTDAAGSLEGVAAVRLLGQVLELAGSLDHLRQLLAVPYRDSRGVISSVFQFFQPCKQYRGCLLTAGKTNNSTHINSLLIRPGPLP